MADTTKNRDRAREVFWRWHEVYNRGHREYMARAARLEQFYMGGGLQWRPEDRAELEAEGRPAREVNMILPTVNAAIGYQIANRVDPSFVPFGVPIWLDTTDPAHAQPLRRLVVAQDTGGAIKGPVRGDLFWGAGEDAELRAGLMKQVGRYYLLLPRAAALTS